MKLSFAFLTTVAVIVGLQQPTHAQSITQWNGSASITFAGTSTLHDWSGSVKAQPFITSVGMSDAAKPSSIKARVEVKAAEMDTKESKRDENMRKALRASDHPLVVGDIDTQFSHLTPGIGATPQVLPFNLVIMGKSQSSVATISNWKQKGDSASFEMDFDVSMKTYSIRVPSVMLVIRVGDVVKVHAKVTLEKVNA
ncbi:YceI-like domain-containing protein [Roseimicrobium gellanilyticum]|uniref:YceI-like domain-containing protein n=1 Tax=Roseimicrobium gellanilyticum TaxID=748857 RepID=A0A366HSH7_9BACT|nr:YceI family protein [Roseimicrobium gellanilyticum]RBP46456.1 YceI-like domain-containing protein [Roseimicrobium gellanilyticum]